MKRCLLAQLFRTASSARTSGRLITRKRIVCSILYILFFMHALPAESADYVVGRRDLILAISIDSTGQGFAVGNKGLVLKTRNNGQTWTRVETGKHISFNDVAADREQVWIIGQDGTVMYSSSGGDSWTQQSSPADVSLMQITFLDEKSGFVVGEGGTAMTTDDGGATWRLLDLDWMSLLPEEVIMMGVVAPNLYDIFFIDKEKGWIIGDSGLVLTSHDGGATWMLARAGTEPPLFSVFFENAQEGWATGQNGLLLRTVDGGIQWDTVAVPVGASLYRIVMDGSRGYIVGDQGTLLQTNDEGRTWSSVPVMMPPPFPWIGDIQLLASHSERQCIVSGWGLLKIMAIPAP